MNQALVGSDTSVGVPWAQQRLKLRVVLIAALLVLLILACLNTGIFLQMSSRAFCATASSADSQSLNNTANGLSVQDQEPLTSPSIVDLADASEWLMPLEAVQAAFLAGKATVFALRIAKTASSAFDVLFQNHLDHSECDYNMRRLWTEGVTHCNRLFTLMNAAVNLQGECENEEGWDDHGWDTSDCMTWIYSYTYEENYAKLDVEDRERLRSMFKSSRITCGHYAYGLHRIGHRGTYTYVTALRDPLIRVLSYWNFAVRLGLVQKYIPNKSFESWIEGDDIPLLGIQKGNFMVRALCNEGLGVHSNFSGIAGRSFYREIVPLSKLSEVTLAHYECALKHLQNSFALVLDAERINEVVELSLNFAQLFNMRSRKRLEPQVFNPTGPLEFGKGMVSMSNLSSTVRQRILRMNQWDAMLYEQARKLHNISVERLRKIE